MKAAFHYIVKVKIINPIGDNEYSFFEFEEIFENENPIIARENAFSFYQNYVNVLLQANGKNYISDKQARIDLENFVALESKGEIKIGNETVSLVEPFDRGIGVFFKINKPKDDTDFDSMAVPIHSIGYNSFNIKEDYIIVNLDTEFQYYKHYNYSTGEYYKKVEVFSKFAWDDGDEEPYPYEILETPFDWTGYDKMYWWGEEEEEDTEDTLEKEIKEDNIIKKYISLIEKGENKQVEFKTNLLYFHGKVGQYSGYSNKVRYIIAKTICSFLNSDGGFLFIGVNDQKEIQGLEDDFSLSQRGKEKKDYFLLEVDKIIKEYFKEFASKISGDFMKINEKEIFFFKIYPSISGPVFLNNKGNKEFFVRYMASSIQYNEIEEITRYCLEKWGNKNP